MLDVNAVFVNVAVEPPCTKTAPPCDAHQREPLQPVSAGAVRAQCNELCGDSVTEREAVEKRGPPGRNAHSARAARRGQPPPSADMRAGPDTSGARSTPSAPGILIRVRAKTARVQLR